MAGASAVGPTIAGGGTGWRPLLGVAAAVTLLLALTAGRYGYHRDELYFLAAGRHLAWGYVDQPPLTPLVARVISTLAPDSLTALRLPSALAAGLVVLLTGLIGRELNAPRRAQLLASGCIGVSVILLGVGHLLSTSTSTCWRGPRSAGWWSGSCGEATTACGC